ncbi:MAG TPA: crosslink repair DNA glycosylase YcaQ family protein [Ignavibacteria bacterium]|nr:crosslink repair DNA glycosylase YcaQ family protein [Ignavibacteria bacterium]HMR39600.1 crosslink repair DNA glycosylase YcaQ family protein [Ignavibacteria bacterium]
MQQDSISVQEARELIISKQLLNSRNIPKSSEQLLNIIETLGYVQIDTISVVERSHHHILWSRMNKYERPMLDKLMKNKKIFEYWSHAAAYLPIKDFRFSLIRKKRYSDKYKIWGKANKKVINYVLDRIKSEGALQSKDFEGDGSKANGWWNWKPAKDALDFLFHKGDLMVKERIGFQKVYDLTSRVLPVNTDTQFPSESEFYEHLILTSIDSNAIVSEKEITYQRKFNSKLFKSVLYKLEENNLIKKISLGKNKFPYFTNDSILGKLNLKMKNNGIHILSPFDNIVINRKRLKEIFDFEYTIECYVPEPKRIYGYYCLPVLSGNKFAGRLDAKSDRSSDTFIVKNLHFEENFGRTGSFDEKLKLNIYNYAKFTGCSDVAGLNKFMK